MTLRPASSLTALLGVLITCASLAASQETAPDRIRVSDDVMRGVLVRKVAPVYPPLARQAHLQGTVVLKVLINKSGDVSDIQLVSGHPMLAPAAMEAVKQWKYQPYLLNGDPVEVETNVQVIFKIADDAPSGFTGNVVGAKLPPSALSPPEDTPPSETNSGNPKHVWVSEAVMRGLRIENITPVYPPAALQAKVQGVVILTVQVSPSGDVENIRLMNGHPMLVPAAIEAVKQWKYKPYLLNGVPVEVETTVRLLFSLSHEQESQGSADDAPLDALPQGGIIGGVIGTVVTTPPPGTPAPALPHRIRVSSGVASGLLKTKVNPHYPPEARDQRIQGVVLLQVKIDDEGNVYDVELISGHPLLAEAAIDAVRQWKYKPYLLNGVPVEVETQVQVNFTLTE
ncbi:MAG: energy transducer TonB [Candidatus Sulfotelmatobacter sp.]